jgi:hypothetical protein
MKKHLFHEYIQPNDTVGLYGGLKCVFYSSVNITVQTTWIWCHARITITQSSEVGTLRTFKVISKQKDSPKIIKYQHRRRKHLKRHLWIFCSVLLAAFYKGGDVNVHWSSLSQECWAEDFIFHYLFSVQDTPGLLLVPYYKKNLFNAQSTSCIYIKRWTEEYCIMRMVIIYILLQILLETSNYRGLRKEGMYHTWERSEMHTKLLSGNQKGRNHLKRSRHGWEDNI